MPVRGTYKWLCFTLASVFTVTHAQNVSQALSKSSTCGAICQSLIEVAVPFERASFAHLPLDDFYSIPTNFSSKLAPGIPIRIEAHTDLKNYTVPSGLTMSRIVYTSKSLNGTTVPASAFVLWPYQAYRYSNTSSKFPIVAWSHGTAGVFAPCAPSNYRSLQYSFMTSWSLALEGFAVVATDYAGLGVTTRADGDQSHEYFAAPAGANDVAYAIEAARKAFPDQFEEDGPFVEMGHSQGGNVAWGFAERQAQQPVPGYKGTIAISPPTRVIDWIDNALALNASASDPSQLPAWAPVVISNQPRVIAAITAVYPELNYTGMTPTSYDRWINVMRAEQGCLAAESVVFADLPEADLAVPGWSNNSIVQEWADRVAVSGKPFKGPLLVIGGENDLGPVELVYKGADDSCAVSGDQSLEVVIYQAMQHFPVIQASRMKWMNWIKEKVSGIGAAKDSVCGKRIFEKGFNTNYTLQFVTPNWLVQPAPAEAPFELAF